MNRRRLTILAFAISAVLLAAALAALDWRDFLLALARVQAEWLVLAATLVATAALLRAARWRVAAAAPASLTAFWRAANIGNLGNTIYPLRAGEALRIGALARFARIDPTAAAASSALDRAAEGVVLFGVGLPALLLLAPALRMPESWAALGGAAVLAAAALVASRFQRPRAALRRFAIKLRGLATARRMAPAVGLTAAACACDVAFTWAVLRALQLEVGLAAAVATNVCLVFAGLLPGAPAGLGAHQAASLLALGMFGVAAGEAIAFSALAHVMTAVIAVLLGLQALGGWPRRVSAAG